MSSIVLNIYSDATRSTFIAAPANSKWSIRAIGLGFIGLIKENEIKETKICPHGNSKRLGLRMIHAMVGCTTSVNPFAGKREEKWEEIEGVEGKFVLSWGFSKKLYRILSDYIHFASTNDTN